MKQEQAEHLAVWLKPKLIDNAMVQECSHSGRHRKCASKFFCAMENTAERLGKRVPQRGNSEGEEWGIRVRFYSPKADESLEIEILEDLYKMADNIKDIGDMRWEGFALTRNEIILDPIRRKISMGPGGQTGIR